MESTSPSFSAEQKHSIVTSDFTEIANATPDINATPEQKLNASEPHEISKNIWMHNPFRKIHPDGANKHDLGTWRKVRGNQRYHLDFFEYYLPNVTAYEVEFEISGVDNPFAIPPDDATDDKIRLRRESCG